MKKIKEIARKYSHLIIGVICIIAYLTVLLPDQEVEPWLKTLAGIPVFGWLVATIVWYIWEHESNRNN